MKNKIKLGALRLIMDSSFYCYIFEGAKVLSEGYLFELSHDYDNYTVVKLDIDDSTIDLSVIDTVKYDMKIS